MPGNAFSSIPVSKHFSESSIVKFIENQIEHLSKLLYHFKKRATRRPRRAREPSTAISKRSQQE